MKELKDFIHLYIGCDVLITDEELAKDLIEAGGNGRGVLTGLHGEYGPEFAAYECHHTSESPEYTWHLKLILRPLESITEGEAKQYARLRGYNDDYIVNFKFKEKGFEFGTGGSKTFLCLVPPHGDRHTPECFRYLLSKGFDLFGLKDAGLAIYETDLKQ